MRKLFLEITASALAIVAMAFAPSVATAQTWSDGFESYSNGTVLDNVGGWAGWDDTSSAAASVTNTQARTGANSVLVGPAADAVHPFAANEFASGIVEVESWMMLTSNEFTADTFFIIQNDYAHGGPYDWTTQLKFELSSGNVIAESNGGGGTAAINLDQWTQIRVRYDLDADTQETFYNGALMSTGTVAPGPLEIANVNLFSTGATSYFDDLSITTVPEPATGSCLLLGLVGTVLIRRKKR